MLGVEYSLNLLVGLAPLAIALYIVWRSRSRRRIVLAYLGGRVSRYMTVATLFRIAGLILMLLAASGVYMVREVWIPAEDVSGEVLAELPAMHIIMVDDSKSMASTVSAVRDLVEEYLAVLGPGDIVAVYKFHEVVEKVCGPGDPSGCMGNISTITGRSRYTAIGIALGYAASIGEASGLPVVVLLVTDGANNMGPDPVEVAESLAGKSGFSVALIKARSDPRSVLEEISQATGWPLYRLGEAMPEKVLEDLVNDIYSEAKTAASTVDGMIPVERRDYTATTVALLLALILVAASKVAGP